MKRISRAEFKRIMCEGSHWRFAKSGHPLDGSCRTVDRHRSFGITFRLDVGGGTTDLRLRKGHALYVGDGFVQVDAPAIPSQCDATTLRYFHCPPA